MKCAVKYLCNLIATSFNLVVAEKTLAFTSDIQSLMFTSSFFYLHSSTGKFENSVL